MPDISETQVPLAAEDRFLIVSIKEAKTLCPAPHDAAALSQAIQIAKPFLGNLTPLFDLRGLPTIYNDVEYFLDEMADSGSHILVNPKTAKQIDLDYLVRRRGFTVLNVRGHSYRARAFDLSAVTGEEDPDEDSFRGLSDRIGDQFTFSNGTIPEDENDEVPLEYVPPTLAEIQRTLTPELLLDLVENHFPRSILKNIKPSEFAQSIRTFLPRIVESLRDLQDDGSLDVDSTEFHMRSALLHAFLRRMHRNSLMVEFVMSTDGDAIHCTPYHGSAIHNIERPGSEDVLVGRPAVIAEKTRGIFYDEIVGFERLLNDPATRERHLQSFLEQHPNFLTGLNYSNVYPQLVLERNDGRELRPDFVLEPFDDMWCDILDIKLPQHSVIVGRRDRATLAAGIHEVAAQLREYAAYFEDERHQKFVREKYGLRVYRPRLIAVVGRDMRAMNDVEIRRAMTAYSDLKIMTFDELVTHARSRLLL